VGGSTIHTPNWVWMVWLCTGGIINSKVYWTLPK